MDDATAPPDDAARPGARGASVTASRIAEFERVMARVERWAARRPDVVAVGLAGSWAAGTPRPDSDVDLVVVTTDLASYAASATETRTDTRTDTRTGTDTHTGTDPAAWMRDVLPGARPVRTAWWGPLLEQRLVLPSGLEIEFGFVPPGWAGTEPVDAGTARVVTDGFQLRHDPAGVLARLVTALRSPADHPR